MEADQVKFYPDDRIGECNFIRRSDGDRHCLAAFFTVERGSGQVDVMVAGTGVLQEKRNVTKDLVRAFMDDMKETMAAIATRSPYPVEWEAVDFSTSKTIEEDIEVLQKAGAQIWTE